MNRMFVAAAVVVIAGPGCSLLPGPEPVPFVCASPPPASGLLKAKDPSQIVTGEYIVVLKPSPARSMLAVANEAEMLRVRYGFAATKTLSRSGVFKLLVKNGVEARAQSQAIDALLKDPRVQYVKPVTLVQKRVVGSWGIDQINSRSKQRDGNADPGTYGKGVDIYDIDTGTDCSHKDFKNADGSIKCGTGYSTFGGDPRNDGNGHGTHTGGTLVGETVGIATQATLHPVQFLNAQGSGTDADAIEAIEWMISDYQQHPERPAVSNNSWGGQDSQPINEAVCRANAAGILMTAAAGNDNLNACNYSPARVDVVLTVGAVNENLYASVYTNTGKCIDLYGPGDNIRSSVPGDAYEELSGTSMADPHVTATAALCAEALGTGAFTPATITACVLDRATKNVLGGVDGPNLLVYDKFPPEN